jgi:FkbM family methyltransferase
MKYYSQFKQDQIINENFFKNKPNGFFVDIGAHDGITFSNSKFYEELGWDGICIEPNPDVFPTLQNNRKVKCVMKAISDKPGKAEFFQITDGPDMLSGLSSEFTQNAIARIHDELTNYPESFTYIEVECDTFSNIVENTTIDFLSIDTEGNELKILQTIDFNKYDIHILTIENNDFDDKFIKFFSDKPYRFVGRLQCDEIFVKTV